MARQSHTLDHLLGKHMASTLPIRPRRKSEDELRRMTIEDRLLYQMRHPLSDEERMEELEREDRDARYGATGEVDRQDLLDNEPPTDWGR